jgi:hypothetical protein
VYKKLSLIKIRYVSIYLIQYSDKTSKEGQGNRTKAQKRKNQEKEQEIEKQRKRFT